MSKGGGQTTVSSRPDAGTQQYIDQLRRAGGLGAGYATGAPGKDGQPLGPESYFSGPLTPEQIQAAMSPYISGVIDPMRAEFDMLRGQAGVGVNSAATAAGAFGGSRHGVAQGVRLGEIDRAQGSALADLMNRGYAGAVGLAEHNRGLTQQQLQEPLWRQEQALRMLNLGMGPMGQVQTQSGTAGQNPFGMALGGASVGSAFGPIGAAVGGGLGLLGGLLW